VVFAWKVFQEQRTFGNQGLRSHPEETKKGMVFGIFKQLKKASKCNDVHVKNETFLSIA
jgi:hypothetical protein